MLSRSRYLAPAAQSLRFYREYFDPAREVEVHKERRRWRIVYRETDFAVNLDTVKRPALEGYFLEINSRTWCAPTRAQANLIAELLEHFQVAPEQILREEYPQLVADDTLL